MISVNPFKAALASGQQQIGLWLSMADPYLAEVSATAGFDWLLIDGEHAPNDVRTTLAALQAIAPYRAQPVVRAVAGNVPLIKQLLDIGAQNLLIPMVDTAEQAAVIVSATRYPPPGYSRRWQCRGTGFALERACGLFGQGRRGGLSAGSGGDSHCVEQSKGDLRGGRGGWSFHRSC
jgi:4-hydroxy-2-oxoheptanedioate aldolase